MIKAFNDIKTPAYVVDIERLKINLEVLKEVEDHTGVRILLAQKAFSMYHLYPLIGQYLAGTSASGLYEARLGHEHMKDREVHVYSPGFGEGEMMELVGFADHITFNSPGQWDRFRPLVEKAGRHISCGLRINPEYSEVETEIYNPCAPGSRLGIRPGQLERTDLSGIEGLMFHVMCEQGADVLERTLKVVEEKFGKYFKGLKWVNFGGGHHITREGYDLGLLERLVKGFMDRYGVEVYLEPGEAVALNAGYLVASVEDIVPAERDVAILDASAATHMPDVLEMPYRPQVIGAGVPGEKQYDYRLAGPTCLAGDIIGDYSFSEPLKVGDRLVFTDMAIYTMVKNNTFNGRPLPDIAVLEDGFVKVVKSFGYGDFKGRL
ncbi:MAG: carboxynorspermidine decarboxylase [Lachnospiraceae bacterium]|nr:carboxynorspermidine decarboxylase [Lachnospiraceae bacterium]